MFLKIVDLIDLFGYSSFNENLSKWYTSSVVEMYSSFYDSKFNQDISKWRL